MKSLEREDDNALRINMDQAVALNLVRSFIDTGGCNREIAMMIKNNLPPGNPLKEILEVYLESNGHKKIGNKAQK